jgi:3-deoxy-D-manno-octulosonic-acid transferase
MMMRPLIGLISWIQSSFFMRIFGVRLERRNAFLESRFFQGQPCKEPITWFHAASLGELEMLKPLIEDFHARGIKIGVSAFSDSALPGLKSVKSIAIFADLSPREDEWKRLFDRFNVQKLILAKYDFWPGLLQAAAKRNAPVIVINAQMRNSLLYMKHLFRGLGEKFPKLILFANDIVSLGELRVNVGKGTVLLHGVDPRWERVARRKQLISKLPTLKIWIDQIEKLAKPVGIVGSAWPEDLAKLLPALKSTEDSLVIVPHDLSAENIREIKILVRVNEMIDRTVIVDEMGMLVELYAHADWAFVGGGFGKGIHSLLEPASFSIPVACGPQKFRDFPETRELSALGLVTRCETTADISRWLAEKTDLQFDQEFIGEKRAGYHALLEKCIETRGT